MARKPIDNVFTRSPFGPSAAERIKQARPAPRPRPKPKAKAKPKAKPKRVQNVFTTSPFAGGSAAERISGKRAPRRRAPAHETRRRVENTAAAIDAFKQSPQYVKALQEARRARVEPEKERRRGGDIYHGFGLKRLSAKDELRERDFSARNRSGVDVPRTDAELRQFLKTGRKITRGRGYLDERAERSAKRAETLAPAMKALDLTMRPTYAIAGATSAALRGKDVSQAAKKGITGKEKKTFSTVLREQGVEGPTAAILGFAADVVADPTTYVSFGTGSAIRKAASKEATKAAKQAAKAAARSTSAQVAAGKMTKAEAKGIIRQRARDAAETATRKTLEKGTAKTRTEGADLRFAGRSVPGVTRGTAAARRGASRVTAPVGRTSLGTTLRKATRALGSEAHANVRKVGQSKAAQRTEKALQRETRSEAERTSRHIGARANALLGRLDESERDLVIDAIEKGTVRKLRGQATKIKTRKTVNVGEAIRRGRDVRNPDRLYIVARRVEDDLKYLRRTGRRSGLLSGDVGARSRSRLETRLSAGPPVASKAKTQASLKEARVEQAAARKAVKALPADAKPSVKQAARRRLRHADERIEFLHARHRGLSRAERQAQNLLEVRTGARGRRLKGQAKGYVPRPRTEQVADKSTLERIAQQAESDVPMVREQVGANAPNVGAAQRRAHREPRSVLKASSDVEKREAVSDVSNDVRGILQSYGSSVARGSAARNLNTKMLQQLGERLPRTGMTHKAIAALKDEGKSVYRVRRGELEKLDVSSQKAIDKIARGGATRSGGQYAILDDAAVRRVRDRGANFGQGSPIFQAWDTAQSKFKGLALSTPGYLLRNLTGDFYNAWGDESFWRLARNTARGQKALNDLGKWEKGLRRFQRELPETKRTIKLTEEQASQIGRKLGMDPKDVGRRLPAMQVALLAEEMGVIRQGRFIELMTEGAKGAKPRSTHAWENAVKRTEDSVRIGTFLGGLQRGLDPRESAARASKIHFDYGDLTNFEKGVMRRSMPFYTFSSRNIPLQAERAVTRPGKLATVAKGLEEGRRATGLAEDFREGQDPYEAKQLGLPIKWGGKTYTVSIGLPFTDLNDVVSAVTNPVGTAVGRAGELLSPFLKAPAEVKYNYSLFYKGEIQPDSEPLTRAPAWAVQMGKGSDPASKAFAKSTGLVPDYEPVEGSEGGKGVWGWSRKADYVSRQVPGIVGAASKAGPIGVQEGKNARGLSPWQQGLAFMGPRVKEYETNQARVNRIYDQIETLDERKRLLMRRANPKGGGRINADNATPEFERLNEAISTLETELDERQRTARPTGYVKGRRVQPTAKDAIGALRGGGAALKGGGATLRGGGAVLNGGGAVLK